MLRYTDMSTMNIVSERFIPGVVFVQWRFNNNNNNNNNNNIWYLYV